MRFIATADWQLGMPAKRLPDEARSRFQNARIEVIERIGTLAGERDADFVVVCGDIFDSNQLDRRVVVRAADALAKIKCPVYFVAGNHDPLDSASILLSSEFKTSMPENVVVVTEAGAREVAPGVDLVSAPWFTKFPVSDLVADVLEAAEPAPSRVRILAGHGGLLGIDTHDPAAVDERRIQQALDEGLIDFAVLGDRHSLTEVAAKIWYPGAPEVTHRREDKPGHVLLVEINSGSKEVTVTPEKVGIWKFVTLTADLTGTEDIAQLAADFESLTDKSKTAVWLSLTGTISISAKATLDDLIEQMGERFALVQLWERHTDLVIQMEDQDFASLGLAGFAADAVHELAGLAATDESARDALGLLLRLNGALK
ncbi:MAG TPA: metallophosphoesterase [Aeromicrobium sp.]|nr:metallophosphoesterase [Aeromicrobium sp.]